MHSPQLQWTIDPVADYQQLLAMRAACRWILNGPEHADDESPGILNSPLLDPSPGPHFGVAERLARMPAGWVHTGGLKDVPLAARYKGHCGSTWAWVMPDGTDGLADFILVLHDIATLDLNGAAATAPPLLVFLERHEALNIPPPMNLGSGKPGPGEGKAKPASGADNRPEVDGKDKGKADAPAVTAKNGPLQGEAAGTAKPLSANPDWSTQNSQQLVFSLPRVIRPECRPWIEQQIQGALCGKGPARITFEQWMACTTPYYGQRVTLSPAGALPAAKPPQAAPRLLPYFETPVPTIPADVFRPAIRTPSGLQIAPVPQTPGPRVNP
jgi:hypothetical protein